MVYIGLDLKKNKTLQHSVTFCQLDDSCKPRTAGCQSPWLFFPSRINSLDIEDIGLDSS